MNDGMSCGAAVRPLIVCRTSLAVQHPGLLQTLQRPFATTHAIETMIGVIRNVIWSICNVICNICNVTRWHAAAMIYRWVGLGVASPERGLLRMKGRKAVTDLIGTFDADAADFKQEAVYPS